MNMSVKAWSAKARAAFALFLLCALAACGNKGPLVMPDAKPAEQPKQPVTATSGVPGGPSSPAKRPAAPSVQFDDDDLDVPDFLK